MMKTLVTILVFIFCVNIFSQKGDNDLTLRFNKNLKQVNFIKKVDIYSDNVLINYWDIDPTKDVLNIQNLKNARYQIKLITYFRDTIIKDVDLREESVCLSVDNIYKECNLKEIIERVNESQELNVYRIVISEVVRREYLYSIEYSHINYKSVTGYFMTGNNNKEVDCYYTFQSFDPDSLLKIEYDKLLELTCSNNYTKRKKRRSIKKSVEYPYIIIESGNRYVMMEYCPKKKEVFEGIKSWIDDNTINLYESKRNRYSGNR